MKFTTFCSSLTRASRGDFCDFREKMRFRRSVAKLRRSARLRTKSARLRWCARLRHGAKLRSSWKSAARRGRASLDQYASIMKGLCEDAGEDEAEDEDDAGMNGSGLDEFEDADDGIGTMGMGASPWPE